MTDTKQRIRANSVHCRTTTPTPTTPTPSFANSTGIVRKRHSAHFPPNSTHALLSSSSSTKSLDRLGASSWKEGLVLSNTTYTTSTTTKNVQEANSTARPDRPPRNSARASTLGFEEMGLNGTPTPMSAASTSSHSLSSSPDLQKKTRPGASPMSGGWSKADVTPWEYQQFAPPSAGMMSENATGGGFSRRRGGENDNASSIVDEEDDDISFEGRDGVQDLPSMNGKIHPKGGHLPRGTEGSSHSTSGSHIGQGKAHEHSHYASSSSSFKQQAPSVRSKASSQGMATSTTATTGPIEDVTPWELFPAPTSSAAVVGSVGGMNGVATNSSSHSRSITRSIGATSTSSNHNAMGATNGIGMSVTRISGPDMGSSLGLHPSFGLVPAVHSISTSSSISTPASTTGSVTTPISLAGSNSIAHSVSGSSAISAGSISDWSSITSPLSTAIPTSQMLNPYPTALKQRKNTNASSTSANTTYTSNTSGTNGTGVTGGSGGGASTATGPLEDVLPWELSPPPPSPLMKTKTFSNGTDKRRSEDASGPSTNGKVKSDDEKAGDKEKTSRRDKLSQRLKSKRPMSLAPINGSAFSSQLRNPSGAYGPTSHPSYGQEGAFPPSLVGSIGGAAGSLPSGGPTSGGSTSSNPPVSPSRRSEHSSRSSGDWNGAGGGRHGSIIPRSPPHKKVDLPPQVQRATSRQLPLTGPVEDVAPWEMEEHDEQHHHVQAQVSQQPSKQRSSMSLGGESKSSANHNGNSNNQSFAIPLPSPSFFFAMGNQPPSGILMAGGSRSAGSGVGMHGKSGSYHHSLSAQTVNKHAMNEDAGSVASVQSVGEKARGEQGRKRANSVAASLAASLVSVASAISGDSQAVAAAANASSSSQNHHTPAAKKPGRPRTADSALSTISGQRSLGYGIHATHFGRRQGGSAVSLALSAEFDAESFDDGNLVNRKRVGSEEGESEDVPALHDFSSGHVARAKSGSRPSSSGGPVKTLRPSSAGSNSGTTPTPLNGSNRPMSGAVPMAIASSTSTGATSIVSSMSMAQREEVTPWELYPSPAATPAPGISDEMGMVVNTMEDESSGHGFGQGGTVNGPETQGKGRKTSRPSTSSTASKTLADFGLRRRRSTGGKTSNAQGGMPAALTGAAAADASKEAGSGSALTSKGISNTGISYTPADFVQPGISLAPPPTIAAVASTSSASSAQSRSSKPKGSSGQTPTISSDTNLAKFSTADRAILEELKASIRAREAQFAIKGVGHTIVGGGRCPGKKHHPHSKKEVPYPRSYDTEVVDLDVWETMFCLDVGKSLTWHVFESPPTKVLEIGCGTGTWILHCARTWKDCTFVGLDIVPLHPNLQNVGSPDLASRITWVQYNFLEGPLPFQNEEFDFVHIKRIALGVPEDKWDDFFEEIQRVMKPGGAFEMIEEDLFFPGKAIDEYDDTVSLKSDGSSRKTSMSSIRERASTMHGVEDSSAAAETVESPSTPKTTYAPQFPRPSTPTKLRDADTKNTSPGSDRSTGAIVLPHSRSVARPSLHIKTHDAKALSQDHKRAPRTSTSPPNQKHKTTPFLLRSLATTVAPHNPRDHTILAAIWHGMLESRFVNASPLSLLTAYLEYHFKDVRSHPIQYTFPIPPPPKPEEVDDLTEPLKTPKPTAKLPALSSFRSLQSVSRNGDYFNDQSTPIARHQSSFTSFDDIRTRSVVRAASTGKPLPNTALKFEGRTLNLQLSLRAKEIIACSEPMWEWVEELQVSQLQSKGSRYRSGSIETALLGSSGTANGRMSADITRNAILEMTRDDFDQMLNNFQMDMQDKACVGYALEQRFDWRTFELEPLQDRKAFDEANRKYDQWLVSHRKPQAAASTTHRSRASLSHSNAGLAPVEESTRPSMDDSASVATATTLVQSIRPPQEASLPPPPPALQKSLFPHPSSQLSRAIRIFVAWKSQDRSS